MFSVVHHSAPINRPREGFLTCAVATHRLVPLGSFPRLCTKSGKSDLFSLRPLRISAALCVERPINAENAEIRRGPQRKEFHLNSIFCAKPFFDSNQSITANKRALVVFKGNTVWPRPVRCTTIS